MLLECKIKRGDMRCGLSMSTNSIYRKLGIMCALADICNFTFYPNNEVSSPFKRNIVILYPLYSVASVMYNIECHLYNII